ncbi:MAG: hypothetical protein E7467_03740 [Ruminococcaceae bacterium]|nr:hypothetical protein [Oscillospiraceae bacterium]
MITVFNRTRLLTEQNPEKLAILRSKLKAQNIPFYLKTTCSEGYFGRAANAKAAMQSSNCVSYNDVSARSYVYYIYVRKKDLARAKRAIT